MKAVWSIAALYALSFAWALVSCDKPSQTAREDAAGETEARRDRTVAADISEPRVAALRDAAADWKQKEKAAALALGGLADALKRGDADLASRIGEVLDANPGISCEKIGADLLAYVGMDGGRLGAALESLAGMKSRAGIRLAAGLLVAAFQEDSKSAHDIYLAALPRYEALGRSLQWGASFSGMVWTQVGVGAFRNAAYARIGELFALAASDRSGFGKEGVSDASTRVQTLRQSLLFEMQTAFRTRNAAAGERMFMALPKEHQDWAFEALLVAAAFNEGNFVASKAMVDEMMRTGRGDEQTFRKYGTRLAWEPLGKDLLAEPAGLVASAAKKAMLEGWVANRPRAATEMVMATTQDPVLTGTAFSVYMNVDSMEASKWLVSRPAGPLKDACVEALCAHLLKKGAAAEAAPWLEQLPKEARERVSATSSQPN